MRKNNNKVDSIETGHIVIVDLLPWTDLEKCMYGTLYRHYFSYQYNFTCSLFWTTRKLTNNRKTIEILREVSTLRPSQRFSFQHPSPPKLEEW